MFYDREVAWAKQQMEQKQTDMVLICSMKNQTSLLRSLALALQEGEALNGRYLKTKHGVLSVHLASDKPCDGRFLLAFVGYTGRNGNGGADAWRKKTVDTLSYGI